nr:hypothetical protein [Tessaracoccus coleopterorum]
MLKTTSLVIAVPFSLELNFVSNAIGNKNFLPIPCFWWRPSTTC